MNMTTLPISLTDMLQPISEASPTGADLRETGEGHEIYRRIKDARSAARSAERAALFSEEETLTAQPHWQIILHDAPALLTHYSKDLEVAVWWVESLLREYGFFGLCEGFQLLNQLVERYWGQLYPAPDEDGIETTLAPLTGLNGDSNEGTLISPLRLQPIIDADGIVYHYSNYQQARNIEKIQDDEQRHAKIEEQGFCMDDLFNTLLTSEANDCHSLQEALQTSLDAFNALNDQLYQQCGHDAPPSSRISEILTDILAATNHLFKDLPKATEAEPVSTPTSPSSEQMVSTDHGQYGDESEQDSQNYKDGSHLSGASSPPSSPAALASTQVNRETALQQLTEIANFFRKTEPHSPLPALLERAVRWGNMSLEALMLELIPEHSAQHTFQQLTGASLSSGGGGDVAPVVSQERVEDSPGAHEGGW